MPASPRHEPEINKLFRLASKHRASNLFLHVGLAPMLKLRGVTRETLLPPLSQQCMEQLLLPLLRAEQQQRLDLVQEVSFTHVVDLHKWFRVGAYKKRGVLELSAQAIEIES
jgi:Tfp pilus assembly pilus retraction ATPase PilT